MAVKSLLKQLARFYCSR